MNQGAHIATMKNKSRSLEFHEDPDDSFFVKVLTKQGDQVKRTTTILKTDLRQWFEMYGRKGFVTVSKQS